MTTNTGTTGNDTLEGGTTLDGLAGDDLLIPSLGEFTNATLNGGDGDDIFQISGYRGRDRTDLITDLGSADHDVLFIEIDDIGLGTFASQDHIELERRGTRLDVVLNGNYTVRVENQYDAEGNFLGVLDEIRFGEGPSIDLSGPLSFADTNEDRLLTGTTGNDTLEVHSGNNRLEGGSGRDTLLGGDGVDTLIGGEGNDSIIGGTSVNDLRDVVFGGDGNDTIDGGYGNDELRGDAGNDDIAGGFGADTVIGGTGDDVMTGSAFGDLIFGGDGFDFVNGGFGSDRVNGGADGDRFFHLGIADHGSDWIQDYNAAEGDVLVYGGAATRDQFQVNVTNTASAGADGVNEAFVIYRPTGQILWALVDGDGQSEINIRIGGQEFDLLG